MWTLIPGILSFPGGRDAHWWGRPLSSWTFPITIQKVCTTGDSAHTAENFNFAWLETQNIPRKFVQRKKKKNKTGSSHDRKGTGAEDGFDPSSLGCRPSTSSCNTLLLMSVATKILILGIIGKYSWCPCGARFKPNLGPGSLDHINQPSLTLSILIWGSLEEATYKYNQGREDPPPPQVYPVTKNNKINKIRKGRNLDTGRRTLRKQQPKTKAHNLTQLKIQNLLNEFI